MNTKGAAKLRTQTPFELQALRSAGHLLRRPFRAARNEIFIIISFQPALLKKICQLLGNGLCFSGPASGNRSSCHHCRNSLLGKMMILFTLCYRMPRWLQRNENGNRQHAMCISSKTHGISLYSFLRTAWFYLMFSKVKKKKKKGFNIFLCWNVWQ